MATIRKHVRRDGGTTYFTLPENQRRIGGDLAGPDPPDHPEHEVPTEGVAAMSKYRATAVHWKGGWELHVEGEGVTQVRTLDHAVDQVRDYLETVHERDFSGAEIEIIPDLGGLEREVIETRHEITAAAEAQERAAAHSRKVARELRDRGLSVTDTAAVLGVSRGRVSQLVKG